MVSGVRAEPAAPPETAMWTNATTLSPEASANSAGKDVIARAHLSDDQYAGNATLAALFGDSLRVGAVDAACRAGQAPAAANVSCRIHAPRVETSGTATTAALGRTCRRHRQRRR